MQHLRPLLVIAACALLSGCLPESVNPIAPPSMSVTEPRLEGVWHALPGKGEKTSSAYYHFHLSRTADGRVRSPWVDAVGIEYRNDDISTTDISILPARIGTRTYLSYAEVKAGSPQRFNFLRYDFDWRGRLRIWPAEDQPFVEAVRAGKLRGKVKGTGSNASALLTDTSEHIAAFVAAAGDAKLFRSDPLVLQRMH
jgi:hypothetical protein